MIIIFDLEIFKGRLAVANPAPLDRRPLPATSIRAADNGEDKPRLNFGSRPQGSIPHDSQVCDAN